MITRACSVSGVKPLTDTILQIFLTLSDRLPFPYAAGQYVKLTLSDHQTLPFSIANAPLGNSELEFHIRHTPDNSYTQQLLRDIQSHSTLHISEAEGLCTFEARDTKRKCLFLAGGTGFAPIKAIIEQALTLNLASSMDLYWAARTPSELYHFDLATHWSKHVKDFHFTPIISTSSPNWAGKTGSLPKILLDDFTDLSSHQVFAAGPPELVMTAFQICQQLLLPREHFHSDLFAFLPKP